MVDTVKSVVDSMSKEKKDVLYFLIGQAANDAKKGNSENSEVSQSSFSKETSLVLAHGSSKTIKEVLAEYTQGEKDVFIFLMGQAISEAKGESLKQDLFDETEDFLAHFGVKGMKWGVRRYQKEDGSLTPRGRKQQAKADRKLRDSEIQGRYSKRNSDHKKRQQEILSNAKKNKLTTEQKEKALAEYNKEKENLSRSKRNEKYDLARSKERAKFDTMSAKKLEKADRKYAESMFTLKGRIELQNLSADYFNSKVDAINSKYPGKNLVDPLGPNFDSEASKKYMKEIETLQIDAWKDAAKRLGVSPSGKSRFDIVTDPKTGDVDIKLVPNVTQDSAKHSDEDYLTVRFKAKKKNGKIVGYELIEESVEQDLFDETEEFLAHYGVKGMKWGVRRYRNEDGSLTEKGKKKEEEKSIKSERRKLASSRRNLDSDVLESTIKRLENEKKLKTLVDQDTRPGKAFVASVLQNSGKRIITTGVAGAGIYAAKYAIDRKFDRGELARAVYRGGANKK